MTMWCCPHCGTPQDETARCWVCRRSTVCCATCRHVRVGVAGGILYCGLGRTRIPLRGDEVRPCWEAGSQAPDQNDRSIPDHPIPVAPAGLVAVAPAGGLGDTPVDPPSGSSSGWTLFGEFEA
jgi:hypothetical protein